MKITLKNIKPNPYRDLQRNPLRRDKVEALIGSINDTGYWDNCVVRKNEAGEYELAYGHHRLQAAIEAGLEDADFIVKELDDALILRIMNNENAPEWRNSISSLLESVRGVVKALADGKIKPFDISEKTRKDRIYYAPFFVPGKTEVSSGSLPDHRYTIDSIARFLGSTALTGGKGKDSKEPSKGVVAAVGALHLIELGLMTETEIKDWNVELLSKEVALRKRGYEQTVVQRQRSQEEQKRLYEEQMRLQKEREAEQEREQKRLAELVEKERVARAAKEKEEADRLAKERQIKKEREEERQRKFEESRQKLDKKIEESKQREQVVVKESVATIRAKNAAAELKTLRVEFEQLTQTHSHLGEKLARLAKIDLGVNERELMRQALISVGDWYIEKANLFLPMKIVTPAQELEGMRQKEEAARKTTNEATIFYDEFAQKLEEEKSKPKPAPKPRKEKKPAPKKKSQPKKGGKKKK